jgi:uncharacterized protein (TIGR03437 family)
VLTSDLSPVAFSVSVVSGSGGAAPGWLKVTPSSGTTPAQLTVQATPGSLAWGTYQADIQITPAGMGAITVPVTFTLLNSTVAFGAAPTAINVSYPAGADRTRTVATPIQVWNSGGLPVTLTAKADPPVVPPAWFSVTPAKYTLAAGESQTFSVLVDASQVATGAHTGTLEITGPNNVIDIPVKLAIAAPVLQPVLTIMPQAVNACFICDTDKNNFQENTFGGYYGDVGIHVDNPSADSAYTLSLMNLGPNVTLDPTSGNSSVRLHITVDACKVGLGWHSGFLEVDAPKLTPSKIYQKVTIYIAPITDAFDTTPVDPAVQKACNDVPPPWFYSSGIVMTGQTGQTDLITAQITVTGADDQPLEFAATAGSDAPSGVTVYPSRGVATSTPTTLTVAIDPAKAPPSSVLSDDLVTIAVGGGWTMRVPQSLAGAFEWVNSGGTATTKTASRRAASTTAACTPTLIVLAPANPSGYFSQMVDWPLTIQARLVDDCGQAVSGASVTASFSNGDPGIALALTDATAGTYSATWRPAAAAASVTLTLRAMMTGLTTATRKVHGSVIDDPTAPPIVTAGGVVNNLNPVLGAPVAPGTVAAIYGRNLAASTVVASALPLPTELGGTQVLIGGLAAPLFFVSAGQINVQVPTELAGNSAQDVMVLVNGEPSIPQTIQLGAVNPGIAAYSTGRAIAQHADWSLVTPDSPARPGEEIVLYLVGMGATTTAVASGQLAPSSPLPYAAVQPTVTIDGATARVEYAGLTPGGIGLYQINCQVPPGARAGELPLAIVQSDVAANAATIPVAK